jgi:hypothetical protein
MCKIPKGMSCYTPARGVEMSEDMVCDLRNLSLHLLQNCDCA